MPLSVIFVIKGLTCSVWLTTAWTAVKFGADIRVPLRINWTNFAETLNPMWHHELKVSAFVKFVFEISISLCCVQTTKFYHAKEPD